MLAHREGRDALAVDIVLWISHLAEEKLESMHAATFLKSHVSIKT